MDSGKDAQRNVSTVVLGNAGRRELQTVRHTSAHKHT